MGLLQQSLLLVSMVIATSHLVNGLNSTQYCNSLSEFDQNNITTLSTCDDQCETCFGSSSDQCFECNSLQDSIIVDILDLCENTTAADVTLEVRNCTNSTSNSNGDENNNIFGIPKLVFGIAVGVPCLVVLMVLLCCCCYCCYYRTKMMKIESIKMNLINQPEVMESSVPQLEQFNSTTQAEIPSLNVQLNGAHTADTCAVPSFQHTLELPVLIRHISKSQSSCVLQESCLNGIATQDKGVGFMKMTSIGASKSCQNFVDEDIYVEPDHSHSVTLLHPTATPTSPGQQRERQQTPRIGIIQRENHYSNQDAINTQSVSQQEKYQNVGAALVGTVETENASSPMEYYNFIPNEDMYMYMESVNTGTMNTIPRINKEDDRERLQSEPTRNSRNYVNFSKEQQLNLRLPGAEYGEFIEGMESAAFSGMENGNGPSEDMSQKEEYLYANFGDEEELYAEMT